MSTRPSATTTSRARWTIILVGIAIIVMMVGGWFLIDTRNDVSKETTNRTTANAAAIITGCEQNNNTVRAVKGLIDAPIVNTITPELINQITNPEIRFVLEQIIASSVTNRETLNDRAAKLKIVDCQALVRDGQDPRKEGAE